MALYSFLAGKIRVLERNLINQVDIDRMVDAPDFDSAFKVLSDTDFGAYLLNIEPSQFKQVLEDDFRKVRDLITGWVEEKELLEFLFLKNDAHNIKLYLKAKRVGDDTDVDAKTSFAGLTEPVLIKRMIVDEMRDTVLHPTTEILMQKIKERLSSEPDGFEIDSVVDLALFDLLDERVGRSNRKIIKDLYKIQKEKAWVKTFLRAKLLKLPASDLIGVLPESYLKYHDLDIEVAANVLPIEPKIKKAYLKFLEHKQLWKLEKELEEAELDVIRGAKYKTDGPEPVIGYYYAKENAVRNLRLILTAKMNEIEAGEIKQRVRALY